MKSEKIKIHFSSSLKIKVAYTISSLDFDYSKGLKEI